MKTEVEFLQALATVMESDRPSIAILNILEAKVSNRLDRLVGGIDDPDDGNRRIEGSDA